MKCPSCGAEIGNGRFCSYCGTQITSEMLREKEILNKAGCPRCSSTNVTFKRENQGEVRGKNGKRIVHCTVGVCKDCGYTWRTDSAQPSKKRKTWLWVLGWIYCFPIPLTIILLKKKDMKPVLKYGLIAAAWLFFLLFYIMVGTSGADDNTTSTEPVNEIVSEADDDNTNTTEPDAQTTIEAPETTSSQTLENKTVIDITDGEKGEYGKEITMSAGTDMEEKLVVYYVPAGKYTVKNLGEYRTQVSVYEGFAKNNETGYDEYTDTGDIVVLDVNGEDEIEVPDGWFIEIHGAHILLTEK